MTGKGRHTSFQRLESARIEQIEIYRLDVPLRRDFNISGSVPGHANNVLVRIQSADGLTGWGEASPVSRVTGETQTTCIANARIIKNLLLGRDAGDISACISVMDRRIRRASTIKSAFDIALHDLAARRARLPLWKFLGGTRPPVLLTDATIFLRPLAQVATRARELKSAGFRIIKIKLGDVARDDLERIRIVREVVGDSVELRADANEGWTAAYAKRLLPALKELGVVFCEQPLPASHRASLRTLAMISPLPLMADESLFSPRDAARIIREESFPLFNIKLSKSGGLHHAGGIARIADEAGVPCMVGCMNESRLGLTASAHFAAALRIVKFYDLDSFLMQTEDWTDGGVLIRSGRALLPQGDGLAAEPHRDWLKKQKPVA